MRKVAVCRYSRVSFSRLSKASTTGWKKQKGQTYDFLFVYKKGKRLNEISRLFDKEHSLQTSIDTIFTLNQINEDLAKEGWILSKHCIVQKI